MLAENAKFIVYYGFISALKLGDDLIWYGTFCIIIYIVRGQLEVYNTYSCKLCQLENYKISSLSSFIILLYSVHFHSSYYYTQSTFIHYIIILSPLSFIILLYTRILRYTLFTSILRYTLYTSVLKYTLYRRILRYTFYTSVLRYTLYTRILRCTLYTRILRYTLYRRVLRYNLYISI